VVGNDCCGVEFGVGRVEKRIQLTWRAARIGGCVTRPTFDA
jgi:hypothetical protein